MLDPEQFMQNSPFLRAHPNSYNLANTTSDLLKFQLQEQTRLDPLTSLTPLLMEEKFEAKFAAHLDSALSTGAVSVDDSCSQNDEFLRRDSDSGASSPASDVLEALCGSAAPNHLNLKVLIENSVFDVSKVGHTVLSLGKVKLLKQKIADKREHKEYLQQRISTANSFCNTLLVGPSAKPADVDSDLLVKIIRQNIGLEQEFMDVTAELEALEDRLKNHNFACLVLGYVEDVKLSSNGTFGEKSSPAESLLQQRSFEALFSHIASVAVQKGVNLPAFDGASPSLDSKIQWAQKCIDTLFTTSSSSASTATAPSTALEATLPDASILQDHSFLSPAKGPKMAPEKSIAEYKVALNDLRFSHQYFMKEYDYLKENSLKTILDYRKKNAALEKEIAMLRKSNRLSQPSVEVVDAKDKEIARLRKEISLMKIDHMGSRSPRSSSTLASPSLFWPDNDDDDTQLPHSASSFRSNTKSNTSTAILRKEFKKIVSEIQDRHEVELSEERHLRRQLEEKLQKETS